MSPSAKNRQSWKFIVVKDEITRASLAEAADGQLFVGQAPVIIVACGTEPESIMLCGQYMYTVDLSIATSYMVLVAYEEGLGTCWLGRFDEKKIKEILKIPDGIRVVTMMALGYSDGIPDQRPRKSLDEIICYEEYNV